MTTPVSPPASIRTPPPALRLADLLRELPGATLRMPRAESTVLLGLHHDSRAVEPGDLFVAREGGSVSGLDYAKAAIERGAVAILARRGAITSELPVPLVEIDDVPRGMALASSAIYGHPTFGLDVVGITGTNGKTTTAELVWGMGTASGYRVGKIGTLGYRFEELVGTTRHTSPEADELARIARDMRNGGATHLTLEVSSIALSYKRMDGVRFRVAAFTNLSQDHLDFHGDMASYAAAKARLFRELSPSVSVVNRDDELGRRLLQDREVLRTLSYSTAADVGAEIYPSRCVLDAQGIRLAVETPWGRVNVASPLVGSHNVENLLAAVGIGLSLDWTAEQVGAGLSTDIPVPGRLERCDDPARDDIVVLVDYAHTPDALARALESVRTVSSAQVHCVFGCGGDRDPQKRSLMGRVAGQGADQIVVTNDNPRSEDPELIAEAVCAGIRSTGHSFVVELDRHKAIAQTIAAANPGDVVLVAGKGHETYQIIGAVTHAFDDRLVARQALAVRRGDPA